MKASHTSRLTLFALHIGAGAGDERRLEAAELIVSWYSVASRAE